MNHPYRESSPAPPEHPEGNGLDACLVCGARTPRRRVRWGSVLVAAGALGLAAGNVAWATLACSYERLAHTVIAAAQHPSVVVMPRQRVSGPPAAIPAAFRPPPPPAPPAPPPPPPRAFPPADLARFGVVKLSRSAYVVDRAVVDDLLEEQSEFGSPIRVVPVLVDGRPAGIGLHGIDPDSLAGVLGLQNGDCLLAMNGVPMTSPEQVLRAYAVLRAAHVLDVRLRRHGKPLEMRYYIE